ncbi:hypothetical protein FKM82_007704 [Ascaphus truei]
MRDKQKRRRERTWAEAARMVLENYSDAPMTPKQILNVIETEGLKETRSGSSPLACLNAMLHSNSRARGALFYKLPGRISLFTMKKDALQWSRGVSLPEGGDAEDPVDEESGPWNESGAVTAGDNDGSVDETCNASCSRASQSRETRSLLQVNKQKRRSGVLLPRVVLTPLKVNGTHLQSTSGFSGRRGEGESSSSCCSSSRALGGSLGLHRRAALSRDSAQHLRGIRSPAEGQVKRNRGEEIDFETPGSILVNTNLRALINLRTFNALPPNFQQQLLLLLPEVDRQVGLDGRMSGSALNNEFFAHACQRWRERLGDGEFTDEMQLRMRQEMEKEKKVEQWKETFFEDFYGQKLGLTEELVPDKDVKRVKPVSGRAQRSARRSTQETCPKELSVPELRSRTRRSLYRKEERDGDTQLVASAAADTETGQASLARPEGAETEHPALEPPTTPMDAGNLPSTSERVPELHPETSEQKRKSPEPETSSPSLEKKPRMNQRQSFRNTIPSVYTEKPQPTKEEPKVPPIRIQLSRIKPPWLVKGLPAYQICPRIIPNADPAGCRTAPHTPADRQTGAHHAQASIGGGGGPGGGGGADEGGGWSRDPTRSRSAKRRRGERAPHPRRAQLQPSASLRSKRGCAAATCFKIGWATRATSRSSSPEAEGRSKVVGRAASDSATKSLSSDAKEFRAAEAAVPERTRDSPSPNCDGPDTLKGHALRTVSVPSPPLQPQDGGPPRRGENFQAGPRPGNEARDTSERGVSLSHCTDSAAADTSTDPGCLKPSSNNRAVDAVACVLGDVSNTFQNRIKSVTAKKGKATPEVKGHGFLTPERLPAELQKVTDPYNHPVMSLGKLQAARTSRVGSRVEMCANRGLDTNETPGPSTPQETHLGIKPGAGGTVAGGSPLSRVEFPALQGQSETELGRSGPQLACVHSQAQPALGIPGSAATRLSQSLCGETSMSMVQPVEAANSNCGLDEPFIKMQNKRDNLFLKRENESLIADCTENPQGALAFCSQGSVLDTVNGSSSSVAIADCPKTGISEKTHTLPPDSVLSPLQYQYFPLAIDQALFQSEPLLNTSRSENAGRELESSVQGADAAATPLPAFVLPDSKLVPDPAPTTRDEILSQNLQSEDSPGCRAPESSSKPQKRLLLNSLEFMGDLPFFPFPKAQGRRALPARGERKAPRPIKQSLYGKLSKLQLGCYHYAGGRQVAGFPKNFAATRNASVSVRVFAEKSKGKPRPLQCSCSLQAMTMCRGCGAFCHNDCIGPSMLCVLCLVIR